MLGSVNLSGYNLPLPAGLRIISGSVSARGYKHDLPPKILEIKGELNLSGFLGRLPKALTKVGGLYLGDYPYALPKSLKEVSENIYGLAKYKFPLPDSIESIGWSVLNLQGYQHPLPSSLKSIGGRLELGFAAFREDDSAYQIALPSGLSSVRHLIINDYLHPLPPSLTSVTETLEIIRYSYPMPEGMAPIPYVKVDDESYKYPLPAEQLEEQYIIKTPRSNKFKDWFGDSKVRDAKGKPTVVYHGTDDGGFAAFSHEKRDKHHPGFYFADNLKNSLTYVRSPDMDPEDPTPLLDARQPRVGRRRATKPGVYRLFLSLQNPAIIDCRGSQWNEIDHPEYPGLRETYKVATEAQKRGYDGVIFLNIVDSGGKSGGQVPGTVYVAFEPTQIKSALINTGAYSKTDPDIRKNPRRTSRRPVRRTSRGRKTSRR